MALRIRGLVKAAGFCRESLARGVPSTERKAFLGWVREILDQVEEICRELPGGVEDLPRPSREACRLLKRVAREGIEAFSSSSSTELSLPPKVRAPGLSAFLDDMLRALSLGDDPPVPLEEYLEEGARRVAEVKRALEGLGVDPSFLPEKTGRALAWLDWLTGEGRLEEYSRMVRLFLPRLEEVTRAGWPGSLKLVGVLFQPGRFVYRMKKEKGILLWRLNCGFFKAGEKEREDLYRVLLPGRRAGAELLQRHRAFVSSPGFLAPSREIEAFLAGPGRDKPRGLAWDLDVLFDKVNREYFQGDLEKPRLSWGERVTRTRLGSYDPLKNRITLSPLLDDPAIPEYVPSYILFHEMLHLARPGELKRGRLMSHTPAFRRREEAFRERDAARRWIRGLCGGGAEAHG